MGGKMSVYLSEPPVCTHWSRCGGAACQSSAPLWRNSPPRCFRARTPTPLAARALSAAPACCCRAAWPRGARHPAGARRRRRVGCGCEACWGSVHGPLRCAATFARPGWWTDTCWTRPPAEPRRTGAAAGAAPGRGATLLSICWGWGGTNRKSGVDAAPRQGKGARKEI